MRHCRYSRPIGMLEVVSETPDSDVVVRLRHRVIGVSCEGGRSQRRDRVTVAGGRQPSFSPPSAL
jgi:hypothetical protein